MTGERSGTAYSTGLLREVAGWSVPVALAVALFSGAVAHDVRFAVSCLVGAAFDIGTLYWALHRTKDVDPHEALASGPLASFFVFRILVKGALLVVAALLPRWLNLLGMAAGVLIVDFTLATVGSAAAAWHAFRPHRTGG
jgi:hypothetical protein